jgi:hypothetical protein
MSKKTLTEEFTSIEAVVDYLESCVTENYDINGSSILKFPSLLELVQTYFDDVTYTNEELTTVIEAATDNKIIMSLVSTHFETL